ncbi:Uma2 family endonuclease [Actinomadura parmotrematis]|uniref:Uma2 family endonuclease n=1 Tax=Actinomadura parmotrematis TaxID=2864039 RepID=A0ABS7FZ91_9ACTN|nr:Uma2 family endonuclease [Actinomadura parmotrematis]MBW8485470.1 Uma2 family endonuclease [Actinomadura parmotrematis]
MTAMAHDQHTQEDFLLEGFLALDTPEGFRAELIDGEIVVTPPPLGGHEDIIGLIVEQIFQKTKTRVNFAGTKGLIVPSGGACPKNRVIPDGTFALAELRLFRDAGTWMPAEGVLLVLEVTSRRAGIDREAKRHCYARADIPFYLLADRDERALTLFSEPQGDDYRDSSRVPFGKALPLPDPFGFELETFEFP